MKGAIGVALLLSSQALSAEPPMSLSARWVRPSGVEQISLVFRSDRVELVTNSNFLEGPAARTRLGTFEAELTPHFREIRDVLVAERAKLQRRSSLRASQPLARSIEERNRPIARIHPVIVMVVTDSPEEGSTQHHFLLEMLDSVARRPEWKPVDAVEVTAVGADHYEMQPLGKAASKAGPRKLSRREHRCGSGDDQKPSCPVPGYGRAQLR